MSNLKELELKYIELGLEIEKLKHHNFKYPIAFRYKSNEQIVLFNELTKGKVIKRGKNKDCSDVNYATDRWSNHTNTNEWEEVPYDKERGFYHGQLVYCWDNGCTHAVTLRFYDVINYGVFAESGELDWAFYDNYSATMPEFMNTAYNTLEGIQYA